MIGFWEVLALWFAARSEGIVVLSLGALALLFIKWVISTDADMPEVDPPSKASLAAWVLLGALGMASPSQKELVAYWLLTNPAVAEETSEIYQMAKDLLAAEFEELLEQRKEEKR